MTSFVVGCVFALVALRWVAAGDSGGHLFGSGAAALAWDSDELLRVRALHNRSFDDPSRYTQHPNLASYLGLSPVEGIHLPIPVSVLLVGFNQDAKTGPQILPRELQDWFETLDHILPHTRVPLGEWTCKEDGMCLNFDTVRKPKPLHSYVHYNVSVHAVDVTSELSTQFASTLRALSRPHDFGTYPNAARVVDVTALEGVIDGMLAELGILWSYTVLLVNPQWDEVYQYQAGFTKGEIDYFLANPDDLRDVHRSAQRFFDRLPRQPGYDQMRRKWHPARKSEKFDIQSLMQESNMWAARIKSWLTQRENLKQSVPAELSEFQDLLLMSGIHAGASVSEILAQLIRNSAHRSDMRGAEGFRILEPEESCALDMWAGHRRWIMMDFAAMRQDWGPFVGGDGIKTLQTVPTVDTYFTTQPPKSQDAASAQLRDKLKAQRDDHLEDIRAYRVQGYVPKDALREAEQNLLRRFHEEHCSDSQQPPAFCQRLEDAIDALSRHENIFEARNGDDVFMEWFGMDDEVDDTELEYEARMKDLFLAHISSLVSRAVRHIFIPPTLTWRHPNAEDKDISTPYTKTVIFRVYLLTDSPRDPRQARTPFDTEKLKTELMGLKMEQQDFQFVLRHQNILDDPGLATSLAASLHSSTLESLDTETSFLSEERLYFDSAELQMLLAKRLFGDKPPQKSTLQHSHLDVPIFVLVLDRERPVFVDHHYLAKALEDMVIVVQNSQYRVQHPLGITCGEGIVGQTLAAPLKATLSAVLQHLGGLLPSHLGYSPEHKAVAHDWSWSIGANPFSLTSPGWRISQAQKDALHRTYLLDSVDLSVEMVNHGIRLLGEISTADHAFEFVKRESSRLMELLKDFQTAVELWRRVMNDASNLDFDKAATKLLQIESTAGRFLSAARDVQHRIQPQRCRQDEGTTFGLLDEIVGGAVLIAVGVGLYALLPKRRKRKRI